LTFATNGTPDVYSTSWVGPPDNSTDLSGNVAALDVLNAAFAIVSGNNSATSSPAGGSSGSGGSPNDGTNKRKSSSSPTGAVAGGVVGAISIIALLFFFIRRKRISRSTSSTGEGPPVSEVEPFPPGSAFVQQSRFDRKLAFESTQSFFPAVPEMPSQETRSIVSNSMPLLNTPILRLVEETSGGDRPFDPTAPLSPQGRSPENNLSNTPIPEVASRSTRAETALDPPTIRGLISHLVGVLREQGQSGETYSEPPPNYTR
jgi:hypothetical protein